jgi:hypothetical protein
MFVGSERNKQGDRLSLCISCIMLTDHYQIPARCRMKRRELLLMATPMMGTPAVRAQQKAMPVIGYLSSFSPPPRKARCGGRPG